MEVFPEIDLFPRLTRVAKFMGRVLSSRPQEAPLHMSNHYRGSDVEGEAIQPELPFGVTE